MCIRDRVNSIIINANEGGVQTSDLSVEVGKDVWISVADAENATVSYEQPGGETPEASPAPSEAPAADNGGGNSTVIWVVVVIVVIAVIAAIAVAVNKKKKK